MFPWEKHLPTQLRVAWLSLVAALVGLVIISFVQRSILKYLLTFNGYMWISGKPPLHWKAYFGLVQVLSGQTIQAAWVDAGAVGFLMFLCVCDFSALV